MTTTLTREDLEKFFKEHANVEVTFKKVDGEIRTMPCTLDEALIPQPVHITNTDNPIDFPKPKKEKKFNPAVMSVFCTDKQEWRSFRVENLLTVRAL
jgi:hypothetical protein